MGSQVEIAIPVVLLSPVATGVLIYRVDRDDLRYVLVTEFRARDCARALSDLRGVRRCWAR